MPEIHEDLTRRVEAAAGSDRSFGLIIAVVLAVIGLWPLFHQVGPRWWALGSGGGVLILCLLRPSVLHVPNLLWTRFGLLLSRITNPIITAILYYVVFVPIGLLMRLRGKDMLRLRFDNKAATYWIERRPPGPPPKTMANQF